MARPASSRSQDDAMVAYIFQRPQSDATFQTFAKHNSRWLGDESIIEVMLLTLYVHQTNHLCLFSVIHSRLNKVMPLKMDKLQSSHPPSTVNQEANLNR